MPLTDEELSDEKQNKTAIIDDGGNTQLDELSSLEQEIAMMHNCSQVSEQAENEACFSVANSKKKLHAVEHHELSTTKVVQEIDENEHKSEGCVVTVVSNETALEEIDLIAVLKGTDSMTAEQKERNNKNKNTAKMVAVFTDTEGVTIDGEGEFEIIDIYDSDQDETEATSSTPSLGAYTKKAKLSPEEERAMALEQIADLSSNKNRRKQELKPTPSDKINNKKDDGNDYDSGSNGGGGVCDGNSGVGVGRNANGTDVTSAVSSAVPLKTKLLKSVQDQTAFECTMDNTNKPKSNSNNNDSKQNSNQPIAATTITNTDDNSGDNVIKQEAETTVFKRKRKRKVVWDPDAPETQTSFAQYASLKKPVTAIPQLTVEIPTINIKRARPATPKQKVISDDNTSKQTSKARSHTPSSLPNGNSANQTAVTSVTHKKKKVSSEIDRLMGDEGAANMIQAVEQKRRGQVIGNATATSVLSSKKPIMRGRANTMIENLHKLKVQAVKEPAPSKAKRTNTACKMRAVDTWDYVYGPAESMIIRSRSNSSYSSNASVRACLSDTETSVLPQTNNVSAKQTFNFAKPESKSVSTIAKTIQDNESSSNTIVADLKRSARAASVTRSTIGATIAASNFLRKEQDVMVKKYDKVAHIIVNTHNAKISHTFNLQLLHQLTSTLSKLAKNKEYNTVLLTGAEQQFCHGIDFYDLAIGSLEKRKNYASQLSSALRTYIKTLATYPKPILTGVSGNLKNFGVMQLPLFDYVLAHDKSTFEVIYSKIGQTPEGLCLWPDSYPCQTMRRDMFLMCERLSFNNVGGISSGLVNRSVTSFPMLTDEALSVAKQISSTSADEYYNSIKKFKIAKQLELLKGLDDEFKTIVGQWTTNNCQDHFKKYIASGTFFPPLN